MSLKSLNPARRWFYPDNKFCNKTIWLLIITIIINMIKGIKRTIFFRFSDITANHFLMIMGYKWQKKGTNNKNWCFFAPCFSLCWQAFSRVTCIVHAWHMISFRICWTSQESCQFACFRTIFMKKKEVLLAVNRQAFVYEWMHRGELWLGYFEADISFN